MYDEAATACSQGMLEEFDKYVQNTKQTLRTRKTGFKQWWKSSRALLGRSEKTCSVPALRVSGGTWVLDSKGKAKAFAKSFSSKWVLPARVDEEQNFEVEPNLAQMTGFLLMHTRHVKHILNHLDHKSATGPDLLPTRVLKRYCKELAPAFARLARRMVATGVWPKSWRKHWIMPLFKKKSVYNPANYGGIQFTCQVSKIV